MDNQAIPGILPPKPAWQQIVESLSWSSLLPLVDPGRNREPESDALRAAVELEVHQDVRAALDRLGGTDLKAPLTRWFYHQLVMLEPERDRFERWVAAERGAVSAVASRAVDAEANLVRILLYDDEEAIEPGARAGALELLVSRLLLGAADRWQEMVGTLEASSRSAPMLLMAHVAGDRLGDRQRQIQLLTTARDTCPLFAVEQLLERTFEEGAGATASRGEEILASRCELLVEAGRPVEAEATAAYLSILSGKPKAHAELTDEMAAAAWHQLSALLDRQALAGKPAELSLLYADEAARVGGELAVVLQLRAAELSMASGEWKRALEQLPAARAEGPLGELAVCYRALALARAQRWIDLAESLLALPADPFGRESLLLAALLLAAKKPDAARRLLGRVAAEVIGLQGPGGARIQGLMLALARSCRDQALIARLWSSLSDKDSDAKRRGIAAFCNGVRQLHASQHDRALTSFDSARNQLGDRAEIMIGQVLAARTDPARTADLLGDLALQAHAPGRVKLLLQAAQLHWSSGDLQRAVALSEKAVADSPSDAEALKQTAAIHLELNNLREAASALERAAASSKSGENLLCAVGDLLAQRVDDPAGAEKAYHRVLELNPLHPGALGGMRSLLAKTQRWEALLEVLSSLLQLADSDGKRLKLHLESLAAARRLLGGAAGDSVARTVLQHCDEVLGIEASNSRAIDGLIHLAGKHGWWKELVARRELLRRSVAGLRGLRRAAQDAQDLQLLAETASELAERSGDNREASAAAIEAGDLYAEHLADRDAAKRCYHKAAGLDPNNPLPLQRLADLLRVDKRTAELAPVLDQLLKLVGEDQRGDLHLELGLLFMDEIDQPKVAAQHFRAVLAQAPGNLEALRAYDRALRKGGTAAERVGVLERLLQECQDSGELLGVLLDLAEAYLEVGDDRGLATLALQLQRFADDQRAVQCLEDILFRQRRYRELCEFYERRILVHEADGDTDGAAELLRRKGDVELTHLNGVTEAVETFTHLLKLQPGDEETLRRLEEILTSTGDWQRLGTLFETFADSLEGEKQRLAYLHRAAELAHNRLRDEAATGRLYEKIRKISPTDPKAFAVLQKKLERENDHRQLVDLLLEQAEMVSSREEKLERVLQAAVKCEQINTDQARDLYQRALQIKPECPEALEALARIHESLERWDELIEITKRQIQIGGKPARIALLYFKMGSVIETQFQNDDEAFRYYTEALRQSKSCLPALHGLRDLHARRSEWLKVAQTLEAEAAVWSEAKGKADVLAQAAEVYATKLGDRATALKRYEQAIRIHRECMPAALALFEHYASQGRYADAAAWGKVYARRGRATQGQRARFLIRWAEVLTRLDKPGEAAEALVRALRLRAGEPDALYGLLELCRQHPECYDFATAFRELLQDANKREDKQGRAILSAAAGVLAENRGDVNEALQLYRQARRVAGPQLPITRPLADLLVAIGDEDEGRQLIEECRQDDSDFNVWLEATLWLARHASLNNQNHQRALELYDEALRRQPNLDEIRVEMARVLWLADQPARAFDELSSACSQLASRAPDDLEKLAQRFHAAGLAAMAAGNLKAAESNLRRACEYAPEWPYPYIALSKRLLAAGDADNAERELKLAEQGLKVRTADVMRAQAEFFGRRGFVDRAVALYRKAIKLGDPDVDDRVNLATCLMRSDAHAEALAELRQSLEENSDYLPTYEALARCFRTMGEHDRARRATQVVQLALGGEAGAADPPAPLRVLGPEAWRTLGAPLTESPVDGIWRLIGEILVQRLTTEPSTTVAARAELKQLQAEMSQLAGMEVGVAVSSELMVPLGVVGSSVVVGPEAHNLPVGELRAQLVMMIAALKLGYGELMNLSLKGRQVAGELLSMLLLPEDLRPEEAQAFLARVPGRTKRALLRLLAQNAMTQKKALRTIGAWFSSVDDTCWRAGLLVTEDLGAVARGVALRFGVPVETAYQGGLLHAITEMSRLARYYVGDSFAQDKTLLSG